MEYLIDTDVINEIYKFPAYTYSLYKWLDKYVENDVIKSVVIVKLELLRRPPSEIATRMKNWVDRNENIFLESTSEIEDILVRIVEWAMKSPASTSDKDRFINGADALLIAAAKHYNCVVVTNELPARSKRELKIPDACAAFGVEYTSFHGMLEKEGYRFQLVQHAASSSLPTTAKAT